MKSLLFIGHSYHNKTKSSQFIIELLETKYSVTKFDYDPYFDDCNIFSGLSGTSYDIIVLWQIMPQISNLKEYVTCGQIDFFPMYDGVPSMDSALWSEYRQCNIICFSRKLFDNCKRYGLSAYYIRYFPKPELMKNYGDARRVFLWQRVDSIGPDTIDRTIGVENVDYLYLHKVLDPGHKMKTLSRKWEGKVKVSDWFDSKQEFLEYMQECALFFAPRLKEGIGMSFLDAMAMGRCVVAPDDSTMNEYIEDGVTGFLYNPKNPMKIELSEVRRIQKNTLSYIQEGYANWTNEKYKILDWLEDSCERNCNRELMDERIILGKKDVLGLVHIRISRKYLYVKMLRIIRFRLCRCGVFEKIVSENLENYEH